ncbi:hypothetical protein ABENE_07905 [Asticcacaulis benevestitus DSM 16100 = ATCC BAA-896]|uniref:Uncharacterized protein n=1 Tax=Asticcacaulis benevestitus DSM 16100 = ATCC BAA-896 TaxID=1121022 RepID=V4PF34_9CAUL|nr:hypothetical protein ABENE_07905 [Asticcacaulis benevestitus DSM 16100 = ATCC BAA-896]
MVLFGITARIKHEVSAGVFCRIYPQRRLYQSQLFKPDGELKVPNGKNPMERLIEFDATM